MPYLNDQFEAYTLGETQHEIDVTNKEQLRDISLDMAQQCHRLLQILSRYLDAALYDNAAFVEALTTLARRSRYTEIQILVYDSTSAIKDNHQVIALHQRLSSYVHIRRIHHDYKDFNEALLLADHTGYIRRPHADRFQGTANYHDISRTNEYGKLFNDIWQISEPDIQLRRLHI